MCSRPAAGADQLAEPVLDRHVDVLELGRSGTPSRSIFGGDLVEPFEDRGGISVADDALIAEHRGMRFRGRDILAPQPLVEADRGVDALHQLVRLRPEAAAPGSLCGRFVGHRRAGATRRKQGQITIWPHKRLAGTATSILFGPWQVERGHDRDELVEGLAAAEARIALTLLPDAADVPLLIIVPRIHQRVLGKRENLVVDRAVERRRIAVLEIGAAAAVDQQASPVNTPRPVACFDQ